jgi:plasmid stabilization system protein ParE
MRLEFHALIASDISRIMGYYEDVAGKQLAYEFYAELRSFFDKAAVSPEAFSIRERDVRRVNLERFPYHFLFRILEDRANPCRASSQSPT